MDWNFSRNIQGENAVFYGDALTRKGASYMGSLSLPISVSLPSVAETAEEAEEDEIYIEGVNLGGVIIGLVLFLCFVAYLMGYSEIIGKMLWFGGFIYLIKDHL